MPPSEWAPSSGKSVSTPGFTSCVIQKSQSKRS